MSGFCQCGDRGKYSAKLGKCVCPECRAELITGGIAVEHLVPHESRLTLDDVLPLAHVTFRGRVKLPGFCRLPDGYFYAVDH